MRARYLLTAIAERDLKAPATAANPIRGVGPTLASALAGASPGPTKYSAAPHHIELTYVYEVDAEETPGMESQIVPEDEPSIVISASAAETLEDDALPYEARSAAARESEVRGPKSEDQGGPEAQATPKQPRLFNGSDQKGN